MEDPRFYATAQQLLREVTRKSQPFLARLVHQVDESRALPVEQLVLYELVGIPGKSLTMTTIVCQLTPLTVLAIEEVVLNHKGPPTKLQYQEFKRVLGRLGDVYQYTF